MADRHTLHINCVEDFKQWLLQEGWEIQKAKGNYEVIRAKKGKRTFLAFRRLKDELQHLSTSDRDYYIVRAYINSKNRRLTHERNTISRQAD